jgi:hypothetical protein
MKFMQRDFIGKFYGALIGPNSSSLLLQISYSFLVIFVWSGMKQCFKSRREAAIQRDPVIDQRHRWIRLMRVSRYLILTGSHGSSAVCDDSSASYRPVPLVFRKQVNTSEIASLHDLALKISITSSQCFIHLKVTFWDCVFQRHYIKKEEQKVTLVQQLPNPIRRQSSVLSLKGAVSHTKSKVLFHVRVCRSTFNKQSPYRCLF